MNYESLFTRGSDLVSRDATISDCQCYRYQLRRWWDAELPWCLFIMLNPSTADAAKDDPTIRRCISFARSWGMGGVAVVNLFAWRATDPKELAKAKDPVGPENNWWIRQMALLCKGPVVAAWGAHAMAAARAKQVASLVNPEQYVCLGKTKEGHPRHPLYVKADAPLVAFSSPSQPRQDGGRNG